MVVAGLRRIADITRQLVILARRGHLRQRLSFDCLAPVAPRQALTGSGIQGENSARGHNATGLAYKYSLDLTALARQLGW